MSKSCGRHRGETEQYTKFQRVWNSNCMNKRDGLWMTSCSFLITFFFIAFSAPLSLKSWLSSCILSHYRSFFFQSLVVHCLTPPLLGRILAWSSSAMCQWPAFSAASSSVVLHYGTRDISALQQLCICTKSTFDKKKKLDFHSLLLQGFYRRRLNEFFGCYISAIWLWYKSQMKEGHYFTTWLYSEAPASCLCVMHLLTALQQGSSSL